MRSRLIVVCAALMAVCALVAVSTPAASSPPGVARSIEPATLTAISIPLQARSTAMSIIDTERVPGSADRLEPGTTITEPGARLVPGARMTVRQPVPKVGIVHKNVWRFDPDISWYGPGFYGSGTACGQRYSRTILGVAHRSLPCGTMVTFRNPANGRSITVPVIDRGPYVAGRTWDMSRGLCEYLDHCYTGSIQWRLGGTGG